MERRLLIFILMGTLLISVANSYGEERSEQMPDGMHDHDHGHHHHPTGPSDCSEMEFWDITRGMCLPLPMEGMPMRMVMLHGHAFGAFVSEQGPRGRDAVVSPNMLMADVGTSIGGSHYLNLDYMATAEKWTFPNRGYPELLQIGEEDANGVPFLDGQHPHTSPVMGLTLSDTIRLSADSKNYLKLFFAPRGESTDGPVAFMHRPTGMVNPDAPLGHHIGQDIGHISSTVIGASLGFGSTRLETSTFHGQEPLPENVDLPIDSPDSGAFRIIEQFSPSVAAMASFAYVHQPERQEPDIGYELRYSASAYTQHQLLGDWMLHNAFILGAITQYDHAQALYSLNYEFWLHADHPNLWGRVELVQRTPEELQIPNVADANRGKWVAAFTLGYTHTVAHWNGVQLGIGASGTKDLLPGEFIGAYGGNPWTGRVFLQLSGMKMWEI